MQHLARLTFVEAGFVGFVRLAAALEVDVYLASTRAFSASNGLL